MRCQKDLRIRKYVKSQEKQASVLTKKGKFHYSRNMAKALNKRSMQIYADREKCTDAREAQAERHFQMEDCRR